MTRSTANERASSTTGAPVRNVLWYVTGAAVIFTAGFVWGLFALAGRWDWYAGWAYLAVLYVILITTNVYLWFTNPDVLRWRTQYGKGTKDWDKVCLAAFGVTFLLTLVVAALARLSHRGCGRHGGQMADRQGENRRSMWFIVQDFRRSMSAIWPRPSGSPRRAIGVVERLNRMTPYAFRRSPSRVDPPWAMTLHYPVRKAG